MMRAVQRDIHVLRYFSSFVSVSEGRVIYVTDPKLAFCPLAAHLYRDLKQTDSADKEAVKWKIKKVIESKIRDFGLFTARRILTADKTAIPYGASEMLMSALEKKAVDAAVIVCDGAGTVIADRGDLVQGIGARMNSLLLTSPIQEIMTRLKMLGGDVVFDHALIDQASGVKKAIQSGYRKIAVTVSGHRADTLESLRVLEKRSGAAITALVVCTTGIGPDKVDVIRRRADLVWSCASSDIRDKVGPSALMQFSCQIPVFVLTRRGVDFVSAYAETPEVMNFSDFHRQLLVSHDPHGRRVRLGHFNAFIQEARLPVGARRMARFADPAGAAENQGL